LTDEELVISYQKSDDKRCVGELYMRYAHLVLGLCLKHLRDKNEAKDMSMEIFRSLFHKLKKQEIQKFRPWLYKLARNECLIKFRSSKKKVPFKEEDLPDGGKHDISLKQEAECRYDLLEEAIGRLKDNQARCLRAFYLQKKCYARVSEETGMDLNQVQSHIQNGGRMIKKALQQHPEFQ